MHIPDPTELLESAIDRLADEYTTSDGQLICVECGVTGTDMGAASAHPASPPMCWNCIDAAKYWNILMYSNNRDIEER